MGGRESTTEKYVSINDKEEVVLLHQLYIRPFVTNGLECFWLASFQAEDIIILGFTLWLYVYHSVSLLYL